MKSRTWKWMIALSLFAALAMPVGMTAQDNPSSNNKPKHKKYRLIDLGTLGGPNSFVEGSPPPTITNEGTVAGNAETTLPCLYAGGLVNPAFLWRKGVLTSLGFLPGGCGSLPNAINSKGMVAGSGDIGVFDPLTGLPEIHADLFYKGHVIDLGTFGGPFSLANGINERGQTAGGAENTDPDPWNFGGLIGLPSPTAWHGFIWQSGVLQDLGTLGGPDSFGLNINDPGQVTGYSFTNDVPNPTTGIPTVAPFLWDRGRMINLGSLGGVFGFGNALNNHGQVVGFSDVAGDLGNRAFFWERGVLTDIGTLGGKYSEAEWINEAGQVVGKADLPDGTHHAFLWKHGKMTDLGTFGGNPCSFAHHINSSGQVVGNSSDCQTILHAVLWENGSIIDLSGQVLPGSGFTFVQPFVINDRGEIEANGTLLNGDTHAVVLKPDGDCDESCERKFVTAASNVGGAFKPNSATVLREAPLLTPLDRIRSMMRQRYHLPGQPAAPRD